MLEHWKFVQAFVSDEDEWYVADYARQLADATSKKYNILLSDSLAEKPNEWARPSGVTSLSDLPKSLAEPGGLLVASWFGIRDSNALKTFINEWPQPILFLKQESNFEKYRHIILCSDFDEHENDEGLYILRDLAISMHAELRIVHVKPSKDIEHKESRMDEAERELHLFQPYLTTKIRTVYASQVYKGVKAYIHHKQTVDLVAVIRRRHHFLHELLFGNHTMELGKHIQLPTLII